MATDLQSALSQLMAQPSTEQPFLSIYLDLTPDGNGTRPALRNLEQEFALVAERWRGHTAQLASFEADRQRIMDYVNQDAPLEARSVAIFACHAENVWLTLPLQVPVPTHIVEDRYPHVFNLARVIDDHETYAIVLADSQESRILVVSLNEVEQAANTEAAEEIRRFDAGGWAQMIFQRRTDNVIKAHTKEIAAKLERIMKRYDVQHVIVAGNDSVKGIILNTLPEQIKAKMVDYIHLDITSNMQAILEITEPMMREVELAQEADDLAELEAQVASNDLGVVGIADTAMALTKGQVRSLIIHQAFNSAGGECPNCGALRPGMRPKCPYDGAEMQSVDLREIFTARALQQAATVQVVEASPYLDEHEGVGALLRYREQSQSRTA